MEKMSIVHYFYFGTCVRYLQDAKEGYHIHGDRNILSNIDGCLDWLASLNLKVTETVSNFELRPFRDELKSIEDKNAVLSPEQARQLNDIVSKLRDTLEADLLLCEAFVVTSKRYDTNKLLDDIGALMSPNVFSHLTPITQYDLIEAGKCIAFERPTAAAFHFLRATEAELRHFYLTFITTKRIPILLWGDMTTDLRNRLRTKKHTTLYNNLDNIRTSYRNPTQHPDAIYDIHEVQDLCPLCFEVINRMDRIIQSEH